MSWTGPIFQYLDAPPTPEVVYPVKLKEKILKAFADNPGIRRRRLAELLGVAPSTITRALGKKNP